MEGIIMKLYDITQELLGGNVYSGDLAPSYNRVMKISEGDVCNLTNLSMGAHNATHIDAPYHFYEDGKAIDQLELNRCIGPCTVLELSKYQKEEWQEIFKNCQKRLLIKGKEVISLELAKLFNQYNMVLIGVESQSVGPADSPMPVHRELLGKEVVLLEGIQLDQVPEGDYYLFAAPLKIRGFDGAPCRAILMECNLTCTCFC
jgi:arylformamidase